MRLIPAFFTHAVRLCLGAARDREQLTTALTILAESLGAPLEPQAGVA